MPTTHDISLVIMHNTQHDDDTIIYYTHYVNAFNYVESYNIIIYYIMQDDTFFNARQWCTVVFLEHMQLKSYPLTHKFC